MTPLRGPTTMPEPKSEPIYLHHLTDILLKLKKDCGGPDIYQDGYRDGITDAINTIDDFFTDALH